MTIIPIDHLPNLGSTPDRERIRLVCNRDELRSRPAALPPTIRRFGRRRAILPVDPVSGGTWIAVNDTGLVLTLLNAYPLASPRASSANGETEVPGHGARPSRGTIIPSLLHCASLDQAVEEAIRVDVAAFQPFRLLIADRKEVVEFSSGNATLSLMHRVSLHAPFLATSSGLGDAQVEPPRRALFAEMLADGDDRVRAQDAFHRHQWPDRPDLSVNMARPEAWTVSQTVVEIDGRKVSLAYRANDSDGKADRLELPLARRPATPGAGGGRVNEVSYCRP